MANMKIEILKKGDSVLFVNQGLVAINRKSGEVDLFKLYFDDDGLPRIDIENVLTIGYGNNSVTTIVDDNTTITTF